jgi:hypothetical protein
VHATEQEVRLYKELISFPLFLAELLAIKEDAYSIPLSSPILSHQNSISHSKKSSGGSRVERLVVRVLASSYVLELEQFVAACRTLFEESLPDDQEILLALWRGGEVGEFPPRLLYRYDYFKEEARLHAGGYDAETQDAI